MYGFTQYSNSELGFKYIRDMFKVLLDYFIKKNIRYSFGNEEVLHKITKTLDDGNVFLAFIKFNQYFNEVIKEKDNTDHLISFKNNKNK